MKGMVFILFATIAALAGPMGPASAGQAEAMSGKADQLHRTVRSA